MGVLGVSPILGEHFTFGLPVPGARRPTVGGMKRTHALLISLVLAAAVVLGAFAAIRSTSLSTTSRTPKVDTAQVARQNAALDRAEAQLQAELAKRPPAVPALPAAAPNQTVIYKRPPAIARVVHHGEHEDGEHESGRDGGEHDD